MEIDHVVECCQRPARSPQLQIEFADRKLNRRVVRLADQGSLVMLQRLFPPPLHPSSIPHQTPSATGTMVFDDRRSRALNRHLHIPSLQMDPPEIDEVGRVVPRQFHRPRHVAGGFIQSFLQQEGLSVPPVRALVSLAEMQRFRKERLGILIPLPL